MLGKILATEDVAGVSPLILWAVQDERRGAGAQLAPRRNAHAKHRRMRRGRRGRVRAVQDVATSRGGGGDECNALPRTRLPSTPLPPPRAWPPQS